jgi:hypothetical protein
MMETCEKCGTTIEVGMWPFCKGSALDHGKPSLVTEKSYPFITKNFNGQPIEVTSRAHEKALCQQYGVVKRDDVGWLTKEHRGIDMKTRQPLYSESSGVGLPGCWV